MFNGASIVGAPFATTMDDVPQCVVAKRVVSSHRLLPSFPCGHTRISGATLVFGLAGNPVSSLVGALVFVAPALLARQGLERVDLGYEHGRASTALERNPQRDEFVRARRRAESDAVFLEPVSGQESHMIVRAASADVLVHVPRGRGEITAGSPVRYLRLP